MRPANKQHVREFVKGGRATLVNHSLDEGLCLKDTRNRPSGDPNCELFSQGPIIPVPPSSSPYRPVGVCGIIMPFPQVGMQKESRGISPRHLEVAETATKNSCTRPKPTMQGFPQREWVSGTGDSEVQHAPADCRRAPYGQLAC